MSNQYVNVVAESGRVGQTRYDNFVRQLLMADTGQLMKLHCALGICGEAGELADAIKKVHIYGKPVDDKHIKNIMEELGDLLFYIQGMMNLYKFDPQEVYQANADKLAIRYKTLTYSTEAAIARHDKTDGEE